MGSKLWSQSMISMLSLEYKNTAIINQTYSVYSPPICSDLNSIDYDFPSFYFSFFSSKWHLKSFKQSVDFVYINAGLYFMPYRWFVDSLSNYYGCSGLFLLITLDLLLIRITITIVANTNITK